MYILKRFAVGGYALIHVIGAHSSKIESAALNNNASILATVSPWEGHVKFWDVRHGVSKSVVDIHE